MKKWHELIATCFYIGYIPKAPGTFGSLAGLAIAWLYSIYFNHTFYIIPIEILLILGIFSSYSVVNTTKLKDPQIIVIDEVVGMMIALDGSLPITFLRGILGFIFFRIFDIWKPFPIRKLEKLPSAFGVMADDVLAGIYAQIILRLLVKYLPL